MTVLSSDYSQNCVGSDVSWFILPRRAHRPVRITPHKRKNVNMPTLNEAVVLVTGANGGIGTHFVHEALARGASKVYATARNPRTWDDEREPAHGDRYGHSRKHGDELLRTGLHRPRLRTDPRRQARIRPRGRPLDCQLVCRQRRLQRVQGCSVVGHELSAS